MAKSITGLVVSDKADKTIVVTVQSSKSHSLYKKRYKITSRFMAHDEKNEAKIGDIVVINESRPVSAKKHFTLTKVVKTAAIKHVEEDENQARKSTKRVVDDMETKEPAS